MSALRGRRALVLGAGGFIGACLTRRLLREGAEVTALVSQRTALWRLEGVLGDLRLCKADLETGEGLASGLLAASPELLFHAAMPHGHPPPEGEASFSAAVADATANVIAALRPLEFERVVALGSSLEYGPAQEPLREDRPLRPSTPRGRAKAASTRALLAFAREERRPLVVLRPFSVYGPWESPGRFIPKAIAAVLAGRPFDLAGPDFRRDPVFVGDVVDACLAAALSGAADGEAVNVGSGRQYTNREIFDRVQAAVGGSVEVREGAYPPSPPDTNHWVADISKAAALLGWAPEHGLEEGLAETVRWISAGPERYRHPTAPAGGL